MLAVALGLGVAVAYGTGDFFGAIATTRWRPALVVLWSQLTGLVGIAAAVALTGGHPTTADLAYGAAAGVCGLCGLVPFYRALAGGRMAVVAPTSAVTAAVVPVAVGLASGERLGLAGVIGIVAALAGVALVSSGEGSPDGRTLTRSVRADAGLAIAGGTGFGIVFALLGQLSSGSGLWPVLTQRGTSVAVLAVVLLLGRGLSVPSTETRPAIVAAGLLDVLANALFVFAARAGELAVAGVLGSLYPVTTVLLAARVLEERMRSIQILGIVLAMGGATLLAL